MSNREFIHDIVLQVAVIIAFFAIMGAITAWNCARCDAVLKDVHGLHGLHGLNHDPNPCKSVKSVDEDKDVAR